MMRSGFFLDLGEKYKAELIGAIPADQQVSLYREGDFIDLAVARTCRRRPSSKSSSS